VAINTAALGTDHMTWGYGTAETQHSPICHYYTNHMTSLFIQGGSYPSSKLSRDSRTDMLQHCNPVTILGSISRVGLNNYVYSSLCLLLLLLVVVVVIAVVVAASAAAVVVVAVVVAVSAAAAAVVVVVVVDQQQQ
jgi:hypothetical protein